MNMAKVKINLTIDKRAKERLKSIARQNNRSISNLVETMAYVLNDNPQIVKDIFIRQQIDKMRYNK